MYGLLRVHFAFGHSCSLACNSDRVPTNVTALHLVACDNVYAALICAQKPMPCQYGRRTDDGDGARMDMVKPKRIILLPRLASCLCCLYSIDPSIRHLLSLVPLNHFFTSSSSLHHLLFLSPQSSLIPPAPSALALTARQ